MPLPFLSRRRRFDPYRLPNIAARYSLEGAPGDSTYLVDGSNRLRLIADRSGNSAENCLVLSGADGNFASAPDSVPLRITGTIDIDSKVAATDITPSVDATIVSKRGTNTNIGYQLRLDTTGLLEFVWSPDGTSANGFVVQSTSAVSASDNQDWWCRVTRNATTGDVIFYTSTDGNTWAQLGNVVPGVAGALGPSTGEVLNIGAQSSTLGKWAGRVGRVRIYSGLRQSGGTLAFDANFALGAKLATSVVESSANSATVTISATGDLGARICGARDLYQATSGKMFIVSTAADGKTIATSDGLNDFMKTAPFSLSQPTMVYFVGSQVAWTSARRVFDGNAGDSGAVTQFNASPEIDIFAGGSGLAAQNPDLPIGTRGVVTARYNGASTTLRVNKGAAFLNAAPGSGNMGGLTLAAKADGTTPSNVTVCKVLVAARADDDATQLKHADFFMRSWNVS